MWDAARADELCAAFQKGLVTSLECDAADGDAMTAAAALLKALGHLDILVACAGITRDRVLWKIEEEDWNQVLDVNLGGVSRHPRHASSGPSIGAIVAVSPSTPCAARWTGRLYGFKAGVIGLCRRRGACPQQHQRECGVSGIIETAMTAGMPDEVRAAAVSKFCFGRIGQPKTWPALCTERRARTRRGDPGGRRAIPVSAPEVVCAAAARSPWGASVAPCAPLPVYVLGAQVLKGMLLRAGVAPAEVDDVTIGCCRQAGNGPNPARTASVRAGIPENVPAFTVNMACPSGLKAIEIAAERIASGRARISVAGGMESMSTMPYLLKDCRWDGFKMGDRTLLDGWADSRDPLCGGLTMGETAEELNQSHHIPRAEQDQWAARSHALAHQAWESGAFDAEVVEIATQENPLRRDETIRFPLDAAKLAALKPVFRTDGTVTAGSPRTRRWRRFAVHDAGGSAAAQPRRGTVRLGATAVRHRAWAKGPRLPFRCCFRTVFATADVDLFEINEAFAVQMRQHLYAGLR